MLFKVFHLWLRFPGEIWPTATLFTSKKLTSQFFYS